MPDSHQEEEILGKAYDSRLMRRLIEYLRPYWRMTLFALVTTLFYGVLQAVPAYLTKVEVDRYLDPARGQYLPPVLAHFLSTNPLVGIAQIAMALFLPTVLVSFFLEFSQSFAMQLVGQKVMYDLRKQIFLHLQRLEMAFFDRNPVGRLVTRVTTDVDVLNDLFSSGVVAIFGDFFTLLSIMVVMLKVNWKLALLTFSVLPVIILITGAFRRGGAGVLPAHSDGDCAHQRLFAGAPDRHGGDATFQPRGPQLRRIRGHQSRPHGGLQGLHPGLRPLLSRGGTGGSDCRRHYSLHGRGNGFARRRQRGDGHRFHSVLAAFLPAHSGLERQVQPVAGGDGEFGAHLQAAGHAGDDRGPAANPSRSHHPQGQVEFHNVGFAYKDDHRVLDNISFAIEPGETVAVVGHTGAGKTTLTNLLLRFYDVQEGSVTFDGIDIRDLRLGDLRRNFGIVLQDPFLFSGTIASNIRLGSDGITDAAGARGGTTGEPPGVY